VRQEWQAVMEKDNSAELSAWAEGPWRMTTHDHAWPQQGMILPVAHSFNLCAEILAHFVDVHLYFVRTLRLVANVGNEGGLWSCSRTVWL